MNCDERRDSILLYTSGCLDSAERAAVCEHLATGCPVCTATLVEAQTVTAAIAGAVEPVAPPPSALDALMQRIGDAPAGAAVARGPRLARIDDQQATLTRRPPPPRRRLFLAIATTAAACIALTAAALLYWTKDARTFWGSDNLVALRLASPTQPNATCQLLWDRDNARARLVLDDASRPAAGREYELWIIPPGGTAQRSEVFNVDRAGEASIVFALPSDTPAGATFAITDEPLGGVDVATGSIHFAGTLGTP